MWSETTVIPILFAQIALALYYLGLPAFTKSLNRLHALFRQALPEEPAKVEPNNRAYRGKWREATFESENGHARSHPPNPKRPQNPLRAEHLRVLGLRDPAHLMEVKNAYRTMAKTYHPDRYASPTHSTDERREAAEIMRDVNQAYDWLCANA